MYLTITIKKIREIETKTENNCISKGVRRRNWAEVYVIYVVYDLTKQKWHFSEENANYEFGTKFFKCDLIYVIIWPFQVLFKSKWLSDRKS